MSAVVCPFRLFAVHIGALFHEVDNEVIVIVSRKGR